MFLQLRLVIIHVIYTLHVQIPHGLHVSIQMPLGVIFSHLNVKILFCAGPSRIDHKRYGGWVGGRGGRQAMTLIKMLSATSVI